MPATGKQIDHRQGQQCSSGNLTSNEIPSSLIGDTVVSDRLSVQNGSAGCSAPRKDETYQRGLKAGSRSIQEPTTHFCGDRSGGIEDPHGNTWWIATHVEDVPVDEMKRRAASQRQP
jgi:PhnB protein